MNRWGITLLSALVLGILGLLLWELEYQHVSLVLWLLVVVALLWGCAQVAVSLQLYPRTRQRHASISNQKRPNRRRWAIPLGVALVLATLDVIFWRLGFETRGQFLWFLVVVALLWCCTQVSLFLRPHQQSSAHRTSSQPVYGPLFPGSSLRSGFYNEGNEEVWDGNESLPPY